MELTQARKEWLKGILFILAGISLLFHTLGILTAILKYVLVTLSIGLIIYGAFKAKVLELILARIPKKYKS